jgi:hypothetical protein
MRVRIVDTAKLVRIPQAADQRCREKERERENTVYVYLI